MFQTIGNIVAIVFCTLFLLGMVLYVVSLFVKENTTKEKIRDWSAHMLSTAMIIAIVALAVVLIIAVF